MPEGLMPASESSAMAVMRAVEMTLADHFGATLQPARWTAAELRDADRLERERFQPFMVG